MRHFLLFIFGIVLTTLLSAQPSSTFFSTFDAERGNVLAPASGGSLWLGGMKDGRVLLTKLSTDGKVFNKHSIDFEGLGLDRENLVDLLEDSDGTLVGCGNFEGDTQGRGFVFRYDPAAQQVLWAHIVRSGGLNSLFGITQLGPGGDYVLYGNPQFTGGDSAELLRLSRATGLITSGQAKRFGTGPFNNITQAVYHDGALYTCGRFTGTEPSPDARMRNAICKVDPTTLEPLWTRLGPLPTSSSGRFYGRDLIIDNGAILSTFSGDHTGPVLSKSEVYLQKNDLDGTPLWIRQYKLPAFKGEFAEEIISLPDGYMLYGYDFLTDTSRLFLLKTDKEGEVITAAKIDIGLNDEFPKIPARSKILRVGDALFLTALSENNLGQTQGILVKTDLNGWLSDSCGFVKKTPATFATWEPNVSQLLVPTVTPSPATTEAATTSLSTPSLAFSKKCGTVEGCPSLPDLRFTFDSVGCASGSPLLHYTFCNVGGQTYEGTVTFALYDKNPFTEQAKLLTLITDTGNTFAPGERVSDVFASDPLSSMPFLLDTFSVLYGVIGVNLATTTPVMLSSFPFPPNSPECGYANNLDSFSVKKNLCPPDSCHPSTFWKIFGRQGNWINISALRAAPDGNLYMVGRQDDHLTISKMAPDGQFVWTRSLTLAPLQRPLISEIIVDSEGMIVGSGNLTAPSNGENKGVFAFRYNPTTHQVLWMRNFNANRSTEGGILEKTSGGNFLLHYNITTLPGQIGAEILELDRTTGQIVPAFAKRYEYQYNQAFSNVVAHDGAIYATGYTIRKVGNSGFRRMVLLKMDAGTGDVIWSRTGLTDWPQTSDFAGGDLIVDDTCLLALYYGSETTNNAIGNAVKLYLQKTTLDGEVLWVKKYDLAAFPKELVATPDGYVIFAGAVARTFLKTDKEGNLLVSKRLDSQAYFFESAGIGEQNQVERIGQHLYFAHGTARNNQIYGYTTLVKTDLNLEMEFDCAFSPFPITYSSVTVQPNIVAPQTVTASPVTQGTILSMLGPDSVILHKSCPTCTILDCTDRPDLTARVDSITCSSTDGAIAHLSVCNLGETAPDTGFYLIFYDKNPLVGSAVALLSIFFAEKPAPGACVHLLLPWDAALLQQPQVFTLVGADGNVPTPISLSDFPFANGFAECDYTNNLDSFATVLPPIQKLDLGSDRSICQGQTVTLDAGSGYVSYQWLSGPATQTFAVSTAGNYVAEVADACGRVQRDTVQVTVSPKFEITKTISFYPGDTITIDGVAYTQSGTVVQNFTTVPGCDSVVTNILQLVITEVKITCPANLTVTLPPNQTATVVDYSLPTVTTNCPDSTIELTLLQGLPVGGSFPQGTTLVCYEAANQCGIRDTCCFTITTELPDSPCDVKAPTGCIRYDLLSIRLDSIGQRRYRVRMTNTCPSPLEFAYIQLPNGVLAVSPANNATYTAPGGNTYSVRNPNASPFYSVRYKAVVGNLDNGKSDIFEYTLPQQSQPAYIHVAAKLTDGTYSEAHLNTYNCPEVMENEVIENLEWRMERTSRPPFSILNSQLLVRPNPTSGLLFVDLGQWQGQQVHLRVLNAQGQLVLERDYAGESGAFGVDLPAGLASGLYYLVAQPEGGERAAVRFVLER